MPNDQAALPNTDETIDFLQKYFGDEPAPLTEIKPDLQGAVSTTLRPVTDEGRIRTWLDARQGISNLYFMVNPARRALQGNDKASKEDVLAADWLHVDVDPRVGEDPLEEKERALKILHEMPAAPTAIIDSGNGIQAFWRLDKRFELGSPSERDGRIQDIESRCHRIVLVLEADMACRNIDRIMRLPGTINVPTASKRRKGRVPVTARLLEFHVDRVCSIDDFDPVITSSSMAKTGTDDSGTVVELRSIPARTDLNALVDVTEEVKDIIMLGHDPRRPNRWASRSEMQFFCIIQMLRGGVSKEVAASVLLDSDYAVGDGIREKRDAKTYVLRQIRRAYERANITSRPRIEIRPDNIPEQVDQAEDAIQRAGLEIFQQHGLLVRIVRGKVGTAPSIGKVAPHYLWEKFIGAAMWLKQAGKEMKSAEPKMEVAHTYLARVGEWRLPHLSGVVAAPTLRRDFSLLSEPGHDIHSGLFYEPGDVKFPTIPDAPTKGDAEQALAMLIEPLRCFPFVPDKGDESWSPNGEAGLLASSSRSVALSAMLTGVIRPALRTAPMHALDAPMAGTGKGKVADIANLIATGDMATPMSLGDDDTEDRKRLFSVLSTGPRVLVIDNVERPIGGDALCTILTQEQWQDRVLSQSTMETVSTNLLIMATGNNMTFKGDMNRRAVLCRMDARDERPAERVFSFDPTEVVRANRPQLVMACLAIIRAYVVAGRPLAGSLTPMGSFEDWSIVREALVWLGQPDPAGTRKLVVADDPHRAALIDMMVAWEECYGTEICSIADVAAALAQPYGLDVIQSKLAEQARAVCMNGRLNARSLANWFRRSTGKMIGGRRFARVEDNDRGMLIRLDRQGPQRAPNDEDQRIRDYEESVM